MRSNTSQTLRHPRAHSNPVAGVDLEAESDLYTDIPPGSKSRPKSSAGDDGVLECEESFEAYQVQRACGDLEEPPSPPSELHWTVKSRAYITSLLEKETAYAPNPFSLHLRQPQLTPLMRGILLDWMMEVCTEFTLKRETYYMSLSFVDRYIDACENIAKRELQLVGLTAMFIAAKTEEVWNPKLSDFAKAADNGYSLEEIKTMELKMFRALAWRILPPTAFAWASVVMSLWDDYVISMFGDEATDSPEDLILFKHPSNHSYRRFRETMQILDLSYLDHNAIRYTSRHLVAGLLYLMVSKYFYETEYRLLTTNVHRHFAEETDSLTCVFGDGEERTNRESAQVRYAKIVQDIYIDFTAKAIEIHNIEEIYPTVAFLHGLLEFEATFELPPACNLQSKSKLESHYEDFLAFQTHNNRSLPFLSQRLSRHK